MRGDDVPVEAARNTLRTYEELHGKFDAFLQGRTESNMLFVARWGVGKSWYVKSKADRRITHLMEGNLRPLKTYMQLYEHRNKLVVLDDGETLWQDKPGRIIMRELTDTSFPKTISWTSTVKPLEQNGIPIAFETNSRACIICNTFKFGRSDETAAIIDRCQCYYFDPTNEEVARYVADWFWDQTVLDYACRHLHAIDDLTARMFVKAAERRAQGDENWRQEFTPLSGPSLIVQQIFNNEEITGDSRVRAFTERTAMLPEQDGAPMSRASFFRYQKALKEKGLLRTTPPKINLTARGTKPDIPLGFDAILADVEQASDRRNEELEEMEAVERDA